MIIGLDLSLRHTGYALCGDGRAIKEAGTVKPPKGLRGPARLNYIGSRVEHTINKNPVHLVVIEGYSMGSRGLSYDIGELGGVVRLAVWKKGVDALVVPPTVLKKHATGKGSASKEDMLSSVQVHYATSNDNVADAVLLGLLGRDYLKARHEGLPGSLLDLLNKCVFIPGQGWSI